MSRRTLAEALAYFYPLHYQRIVECIHEQHQENLLESRDSDANLLSAFIWAKTSEGQYYWYSLSRAEVFTKGDV